MSYSGRGMHGVTGSDIYPSGTLMVGGYQVVGLDPSQASLAVARLSDAFASAFPMGTLATTSAAGAASTADRGRATKGWGPGFGVPAGRLYYVISTTRDGVSGAEVNAAFAAVARDLARRLGVTVTNTNAHTLGGATPLPALTPDPGTPVDPETGAPIIVSTSPLLIGGAVVGALSLTTLLWFALRRRPVARNRGRSRRQR